MWVFAEAAIIATTNLVVLGFGMSSATAILPETGFSTVDATAAELAGVEDVATSSCPGELESISAWRYRGLPVVFGDFRVESREAGSCSLQCVGFAGEWACSRDRLDAWTGSWSRELRPVRRALGEERPFPVAAVAYELIVGQDRVPSVLAGDELVALPEERGLLVLSIPFLAPPIAYRLDDQGLEPIHWPDDLDSRLETATWVKAEVIARLRGQGSQLTRHWLALQDHQSLTDVDPEVLVAELTAGLDRDERLAWQALAHRLVELGDLSAARNAFQRSATELALPRIPGALEADRALSRALRRVLRGDDADALGAQIRSIESRWSLAISSLTVLMVFAPWVILWLPSSWPTSHRWRILLALGFFAVESAVLASMSVQSPTFRDPFALSWLLHESISPGLMPMMPMSGLLFPNLLGGFWSFATSFVLGVGESALTALPSIVYWRRRSRIDRIPARRLDSRPYVAAQLAVVVVWIWINLAGLGA